MDLNSVVDMNMHDDRADLVYFRRVSVWMFVSNAVEYRIGTSHNPLSELIFSTYFNSNQIPTCT